jgi:translocation and assembly module TamA
MRTPRSPVLNRVPIGIASALAAALLLAVAAPASASDAAAAEPGAFERWLSGLPVVGRFFGGGDVAPSADGTRVAPHYRLDVQAPEPIDALVRNHTLLGRWRQRPDFDPSQLDLFVRRAPAEIRDLLAAEGWFSPASIDVRPIDGGVAVIVDPGPRTVAGDLDLAIDGAAAGDTYGSLRERLRADWRLQPGTPLRSADWEGAKRALLSELRDAGFLRARIVDSEALVDRSAARAALALRVDSGARLVYGEVRVHGLDRYPRSVIDGLAPFRPGDPYDARDVFVLQTRLNGAGWFSAVNVRPDLVELERDPDAGAVPIRVDVVERQAKRLTLGGGIDTDRGLSLLAAWEHRNVAGLGVQTFNGIELDLERQLLYTQWETPQDADGQRWQLGARAEHRDVSNDVTDALSVFAARNRRRGDIETGFSLQYQFERQRIVFGPGNEPVFDNRAVVAGWTWTQRKLDSPLQPTRGYIVSGQLSGASEALGAMRTFVRAYGFGYLILPLDLPDGSVFGRLVVRGELGIVWAEDRFGIPTANLFRTGGDRSVRGYASQSLGVPFGEATVPGRYLGVASVEYQHPIARDVALAAFYDRGNAADTWASLQPVAGWGLGVRWRTPVGPLNFDVARGVAVGQWRLHFSLGVVF